MNKRPKSSKKSASVGIAICFVAAVAIVGTYTLRSYQESERQELGVTDGTNSTDDETKEPARSANTDKLIIDTEDEDDANAETNEQTEEGDAETSEENNLNGTLNASASGSATSLNFTENSEILWPVNGQILLNYSMDKTVYFSTLDQYKYNPALVISGAEGDQVISGAAGVVKSIDVTAQTGTTVNLDLGNGYELFVGQLKEVPVNAGDYVNANTVIGYVSQPTKYYSVEGCNVYYEMREDGQPVDPLQFVSE